MNKINISNAPAYTSPNSMTLICTEKPDGSTNLATWRGVIFLPFLNSSLDIVAKS